jgi:hypothetical protein
MILQLMACYNETAVYSWKLNSPSFAVTAVHMRQLLWQVSKAGRRIELLLGYTRLAVTAPFSSEGNFTEMCYTTGSYIP